MRLRSDGVARGSIQTGLAGAAIIGFAVAIAYTRFGSDALLRSDAQHFYRVALDPFAGDVAGFDAAPYRYGRPLYSVVTWMLAAGRRDLTLLSLAVVYVVSFGTMVWLGSRLTGRSFGVLFLCLTPAVILTAPYLVSEPFVLSLALSTYLFAMLRRPGMMRVSAALLLLAREAAGLALLPLILYDMRRRYWRTASSWLLVPIPLLAWWWWIRAHLGVWPFLDPDPARSQALGLPLTGPIRVWVSDGAPRVWLMTALVVGVLTLIAAIAIFLSKRSILAAAALASALLIPFLGESAWSLPGEAIRLMMPAQVFMVLALLANTTSEAEDVKVR